MVSLTGPRVSRETSLRTCLWRIISVELTEVRQPILNMDITVPWGGSWVGYKGDSIPSSLLADSEDHATSHLILLPPRFPAIIHYVVNDPKEAFYPSIACQISCHSRKSNKHRCSRSEEVFTLLMILLRTLIVKGREALMCQGGWLVLSSGWWWASC